MELKQQRIYFKGINCRVNKYKVPLFYLYKFIFINMN